MEKPFFVTTPHRKSVASQDFTLRGLRYFLNVVEAGTIVDAARRMGTSPSAVSQQISGLEKIIGGDVLDRSARPLTLTPAGMVLRCHAERILDAVNQARTELMESELSTMPELRLAIIDDLDASITPALVTYLESLYPNTALSVMSGRSDNLSTAFESRLADMAIVSEMPATLSNIDVFPITKEPFVVVAKRDHEFSEEALLSHMRNAPMVQYEESMPMGRRITEHLKRMKIGIVKRYTFEASRSVFAMVLDSNGWAITTPLCILDSQRFAADMQILPLPFAGFSRTISMVARSGETGNLPQMLANTCRDLIRNRTLDEIEALAPWLAGHVTVFENGDTA